MGGDRGGERGGHRGGVMGRSYLLSGGGGELGSGRATRAAGYFVFVQEGVALALCVGSVGGAQGVQTSGIASPVQRRTGEAPVGVVMETTGATSAVHQRVVLPRELGITG